MSNIYIDTMGCPKNQEDSERVAGLLKNKGHSFVFTPEDADILVINTCGFIDDAKRESIDRILELTKLKDDSEKKLVVTGCLTQRYGEELYEEFKEVDAITGVNNYQDLPSIIEKLLSRESKAERFLKTEGTPGFLEGERVLLSGSHTAYLKIAEGCSNKCSYCVIPSVRGSYRSMKIKDIVAEANSLVKNGVKELILIAQDVSAYGIDLYANYALPELLKKLCEIDELKWIRLMYCYEERITDELIDVMATEDKICNYIDIPLQHISANILEAMNRISRPKHIRETITKLRNRIPDLAIRTTFITGFPGEMEEDFVSMKKFIEETKFDRLGVFTYSREENTPAADMKNQVPHEVAQGRRDDLMRMQMDISFAKNEMMIGKIMTVLIDDIEDGIAYGRTQYDAPEIDNSVIINTNEDISVGDMLDVRIVDAYDYDLIGEIEDESAE